MKFAAEKRRSKLLGRLIWIMLFLAAAGCTSLEEGYTARYGLTSTEYPLIPPTPTDETYPKGSVGQQYIEEYDQKYHEKGVTIHAEPQPAEGEEEEPE